MKLMGIINCTPDSFFSGSRSASVEQAWIQARDMIESGADILDIGGESSRPGADYVSAEEEMDRVLPVIERIRRESEIPLSLDTRKSRVAAEALKLGIDMINDISALQDDPELATLAARSGTSLVLMHKKGTPVDMQKNPDYGDLMEDIRLVLMEAVDGALQAGVPREHIILDPGIGFGKTHEHNRCILQSIPQMKEWGFPLLIGLSRKSYIGNILNLPPEERLFGTLAADFYAIIQGADYIRVHDVKEHQQGLSVLKDLLWNG